MNGSLVVPAYNEAGRIDDCVRSIAAWAKTRPGGRGWEILVVDDGSTDDTAERARRVAAEEKLDLRVIAYGRNRGKGAAIREGVRVCTGDPVLITDADLSTPLSEFAKLDEMLATHPVAIGSRTIDDSLVRRRQPLHRVLLGKLGNGMIQLFAVPGIRDTQCGFKLFRRDAAKALFADARIDRFAWDVEILYLARRRGFAIAEAPVLWFNSPDSKVRVVRDAVQTLFDVLRIRWIHRG
jgi:dolichyl-phosphate beta-glucosyltransferase